MKTSLSNFHRLALFLALCFMPTLLNAQSLARFNKGNNIFRNMPDKRYWLECYIPIGLGRAYHVADNPYLYEGFNAFNMYAGIGLTKNHFFGVECYAGDISTDALEIVNYFEPNDKEHKDLIDLTKGLHHFVDFGLRYSLVFDVKGVFLKQSISGGLHRMKQQTHSLNYYPIDTTMFVKKTFTTDHNRVGGQGFGFYGALQCELGYRFRPKGYYRLNVGWSIGARYMYGEATVNGQYYEQFDEGERLNHIRYSDKFTSRTLDFHLNVSVIIL